MPGQGTDAGREAGSVQNDAVQTGITKLQGRQAGTGGGCVGPLTVSGGVSLTEEINSIQYALVSETDQLGVRYIWTMTQRTSDETRPMNIAIPHVIYLGLTI